MSKDVYCAWTLSCHQITRLPDKALLHSNSLKSKHRSLITKCTLLRWFLVYSPSRTTITTNSKYFHPPHRRNSHQLSLPTPSPSLGNPYGPPSCALDLLLLNISLEMRSWYLASFISFLVSASFIVSSGPTHV